MRCDEYTPDAICQAMGFPEFVDGSCRISPHSWLRVLLMPSFHPEVCVTLAEAGAAPELSVVALASRYWAEGPAGVLAGDREAVPSSPELLASATRALDVLLAGSAGEGGAIDGMSVAIASMRNDVRAQVQVHSSSLAARAGLGPFLEVVWHGLSGARVRNAVSRCARYLDVSLPEDSEPEQPPVTRILVMGDPGERHELLRALARREPEPG